MERIKTLFARTLIALIVLAGIGFGVMAAGFAIVLGGAAALAIRLAGPGLSAEAERRAGTPREDAEDAEPVAA